MNAAELEADRERRTLRAEQIVGAHFGRIVALDQATLTAEIPADFAIGGFPQLLAAGLSATLIGYETRQLPGRRRVGIGTETVVEIGQIEPTRVACYRISIISSAPVAVSSPAAPGLEAVGGDAGAYRPAG